MPLVPPRSSQDSKVAARSARRALALIPLLAWASLTQLACAGTDAPAQASHELTGDRAQRVAAATKRLAGPSPLPSAIFDAHIVDERTGDGRFGPSDYRSFLAIQVPIGDLPQWTRHLTPAERIDSYLAPREPRPWWVSPETYPRLVFYEPASPLSGTTHGWIGVSPQDGKIFVFTYTM